MRRLSFTKQNRSGNLLHIETDYAIINIHVGLTDSEGRAVERIDIIPDREAELPDFPDPEQNHVGIRVRAKSPQN